MAITATKRLQEIVDLLDQKGYVKAKELSQKYQVSMETIRKDLTFLEEKGVVKKEYGGATCHSYQELGVKKKMIEKSDYVFVVADSSKFQEKGLYTVCSWKEIDGIITDHRISTKVYEDLSQKVSVYIGKKE